MERYVPTPEEVTAALRQYESGKTPISVWYEILRLNGGGTVEVIPYRVQNGKIEVYMTRRPANDPFWPNQLHCPGVMVIGIDPSEEVVLERLRTKELKNAVTGGFEKIASVLRNTKRGTEVALVHMTQVFEGLPEENWYDTAKLPEDTIDHHVKMIEMAVGAIKSKGQKPQTAALE